MDLIFLNLFYRADLSRALQLLLYSYWKSFLIFIKNNFIIRYDLFANMMQDTTLIHIITGFIICIIISITQRLLDLILIILVICVFLHLELELHFYKHLFLQYYLRFI